MTILIDNIYHNKEGVFHGYGHGRAVGLDNCKLKRITRAATKAALFLCLLGFPAWSVRLGRLTCAGQSTNQHPNAVEFAVLRRFIFVVNGFIPADK